MNAAPEPDDTPAPPTVFGVPLLPRFLLGMTGKPGYGIAVAVLALGAGVMGSTHASSISSAFPFCCWVGSSDPAQWVRADMVVFVFWGAAITWLVLFAGRQVAESWSVDKARRHALGLEKAVGETKSTAATIAQRLEKATSELNQAIGNTAQQVVANIRFSQESAQTLGRAVEKVHYSTEHIAGHVTQSREQAERLTTSVEKSAQQLQDAVDETQKVLANIEYELETLPPHTFREAYLFGAQDLHEGLSAVFERELDADAIAKRMRRILRAIASLASIYDADNVTTYTAWIMTFHQRGSTDFTEDVALIPDNFLREEIAGVLRLRTDLSSTAAGEMMNPGAGIGNLVLHIPDTEHIEGTRGRRMGSGPQTVFTKKRDKPEEFFWSGVPDTRKIDVRGIDPSLAAQYQDFFSHNGRGNDVGSFVSFPLSTFDRRLVGVITVQASRKNVLGRSTKRWGIFGSVMMPFFNGLATACDKWRTET